MNSPSTARVVGTLIVVVLKAVSANVSLNVLVEWRSWIYAEKPPK